jgi:pimeloyl-ACP methyl ester carboxylesterase
MKRASLVVGFCVFALGLLSGTIRAQTVVGVWQGMLPNWKSRCVVKIAKADDGKLSANAYLIDQSPEPNIADSVTFDGATFKMGFGAYQGSYTGKLSADGLSMNGQLVLNGTQELDLKRVTKEMEWPLDPTPHKVHFVTVEPGVKLEIVDWGGTGRPLVLLTGLGDTAHVFDKLAPKLIGSYHVYGITRRGYGASDAPPAIGDNYKADRLGDDVIAVLDQLKLERPVLAGHSIAGEELSSIGSRHPERVAGLIYLDAAGWYALYPGVPHGFEVDTNELRRKLQAIGDAQTPQEYRARMAEVLDTELPRYQQELAAKLKEVQDVPDAPPPPDEVIKSYPYIYGHAINAGEQRYTQIKCPALAIYALPQPSTPAPDADAKEKEKAAHITEAKRQLESQADMFQALGPNVRVVRLQGAQHYVFRSNEADVLREVNAFIATLP